MALGDYKYTVLMLVVLFVYLQFFHQGHYDTNSRFQVSTDKVLFHSNWTKSLQDMCCLGKFHDALIIQGPQSLEVSLSMSGSLNDDDLRRVFDVQKFNGYKSIKLDLSGLNITTNGLDYVLSLIQPPSLESLQLHLNGLTMEAGFGKFLAHRLNSFNQLAVLKVSLIMSMKEKQVVDLLSNHKPRQELKTFHLILIGNQITKQDIVGLEEYISKLQLKELHLNLYANKLGAQGAEIVSKALKTQTVLENLQVDLYFNNITETGTQNITAAIENLHSLKTLELNLDFNYIKNEGAKALGKMLEKMTQLQSLSLGVASKNFGYLGFKYVVAGLQKLTQLKRLIFRCGVNRVGYNGAEITKEMLTQMTQLEHLELGFIQNYIGDDGIGLIAEQVASMKSLKRVYLNLAFNDAKSYGLIKTIKSFLNNNYESLHIHLGSNEFRDNDVKLIESHLASLIQKSGEFILDFTETAISKKQMASLKKVFADANQKFNKNARISVNSIIPEQEQKPANSKIPTANNSSQQKKEL